jgi:NAD(P)-dependent dehydrogenase (short-subunit alcohol dehydrogenase family)
MNPPTLGNVLVTGGAGGLGAAVVAAIGNAGGKPYVLDLRSPPDGVPAVSVDLSDTRAAERAAAELVAHAGGVDAVVTAAGIDIPGRLGDVPAEDWERVVQVDLLAPAAVIRACLPSLVERRGHVVTVASTLGLRALSDATAYCAAKFGMVGFTRALAAELAGQVGVTLLVPGGMRTNFFDGRTEQYKPGPEAVLNAPENVAAAVVFALSQPAGCAVREIVVTPDLEPSYP